MRIAALIMGVAAGLFALLTPILLRADLMSPFLEQWAAGGDSRGLAVVVWYALPGLALFGGLLATVIPGFAALMLFAAAFGWALIGVSVPGLFDYRLLAPAGAAALAAALAMIAGELQIRARRVRRRERRAEALLDDEGEIDREAALRMDPVLVARDDMPPPPRRTIPLTIDDVAVTAKATTPRSPEEEPDAEPTAPRADNWAEAIESRPASDRDLERETTARSFRWDDLDAPDFMAGSARRAPGPRFEPRREPAPIPPAGIEILANDPPSEDNWPEPTRAAPAERDADEEQDWEPPRTEPARGSGRRSGVLVPIVAGVAAVVLVLALATGGFYAYRSGLLAGLLALAEPEQPEAVVETQPAVETATGDPEVLPTREAGAPAGEDARPDAAIVPLPTPLAETEPPAAQMASFGDPFSYCLAVGTIDYADERYSGPALVAAITRALSVGTAATRDRVRWRCADGRVLACTSYIGPICDKAPSVDEMRAYCQIHTDVETLLAPHGIWSCVEGRPQLPDDATWRVDSRGYLPGAWVVVRPDPAPST